MDQPGQQRGKRAAIEIDVSEAQDRLEDLLDLVVAGEEIVVTRRGLPVARLTAVEPPRKKIRTPGSARGQIFVSDAFDDPLPPEIQDAFEGRDQT